MLSLETKSLGLGQDATTAPMTAPSIPFRRHESLFGTTNFSVQGLDVRNKFQAKGNKGKVAVEAVSEPSLVLLQQQTVHQGRTDGRGVAEARDTATSGSSPSHIQVPSIGSTHRQPHPWQAGLQ